MLWCAGLALGLTAALDGGDAARGEDIEERRRARDFRRDEAVSPASYAGERYAQFGAPAALAERLPTSSDYFERFAAPALPSLPAAALPPSTQSLPPTVVHERVDAGRPGSLAPPPPEYLPGTPPAAWYGPGALGCYGRNGELYTWQVLPDGLIYKSYLAGVKESRLGFQIFHEQDDGWLWDISLGGRVGILRYGTTGALNPEGWQLDLEGAAFPRLDPQENMDLASSDFRAGVPLTWSDGPWRTKFAYYHLSSHFGDEFLLRTGTTTRVNYSRDALVLGVSYYTTPDFRLYAEADWAVIHRDVTGAWAFQFGAEYSPAATTLHHFRGDPFFAVAGHLREEIDFSGHLVVQAGWQWRGAGGDLLRLGVHYHNGLSPQFETFDRFEQQIGAGVWYDF